MQQLMDLTFDVIVEIYMIGEEDIIAKVGENGAGVYLPNPPLGENYETIYTSARGHRL